MEHIEKLFGDIGFHLLNDEAPSSYLDSLSRQSAFKRYPFTMLLVLRSTEQSPVHHPEGNVWNHTLLVVDEAAKRKSESQDAAAFLWAALLHDIGKPLTTKLKKGRITAYDHDTVGATLSKDFLSALTTDRSLIEKVAALVRFHMHILYVVKRLPFANINEMKRRTDIHEVALLGLCDRLGRTGAAQSEEEEQVRLFIKLCHEQKEGGT